MTRKLLLLAFLYAPVLFILLGAWWAHAPHDGFPITLAVLWASAASLTIAGYLYSNLS